MARSSTSRGCDTELQAGGCNFEGGSDPEVIIEACEARGVEAAVRLLIGMFLPSPCGIRVNVYSTSFATGSTSSRSTGR